MQSVIPANKELYKWYLEWGFLTCPLVSSPKRWRKKTILSSLSSCFKVMFSFAFSRNSYKQIRRLVTTLLSQNAEQTINTQKTIEELSVLTQRACTESKTQVSSLVRSAPAKSSLYPGYMWTETWFPDAPTDKENDRKMVFNMFAMLNYCFDNDKTDSEESSNHLWCNVF